mmetsp:Transcript_15305/g.47531  ORF Transcript_15305/g.47531 Transcript_15305/m.47531 type:complete len:90 (+) Transcript_15305:512-781(+)
MCVPASTVSSSGAFSQTTACLTDAENATITNKSTAPAPITVLDETPRGTRIVFLVLLLSFSPVLLEDVPRDERLRREHAEDCRYEMRAL